MEKLMRSNFFFYQNRLLCFRDRFLVGMVEWTKPRYTRWFKKNQIAWPQTLQTLKELPRHSLGHDLALFLEREGLHLMPKLETHDVLHVLMNYETTVIDEARMQFFLLGNGKHSLYALFTAVASLLLIPEGLGSFFREFAKGRSCRNISKWKFEYLLAEPTSLLRRLVFEKNKDVGVEAPLVF